MKNVKWAVLTGVAFAATCGLNQQLMAQADEDADSAMLEEIIVTATKREESIYEVPIAITAFSQAMIERQGITSLVDIGKFVPNLNVTGFSAGHTSSVNAFIRGIGLQDHLISTCPLMCLNAIADLLLTTPDNHRIQEPRRTITGYFVFCEPKPQPIIAIVRERHIARHLLALHWPHNALVARQNNFLLNAQPGIRPHNLARLRRVLRRHTIGMRTFRRRA